MENGKKIFLISGILGGVLVVGVLGFWLFTRRGPAQNLQTTQVTEQASTNVVDSSQTVVVTTTTPSPALTSFEAQVNELGKTDQDLDGLSDSEEAKYGTSPTSADTDNDGLLDKDEITIFHTDPLKADTDGDGHPDGLEVRNGYNPNGEGKLIIAH
jgi:hypothetical protein